MNVHTCTQKYACVSSPCVCIFASVCVCACVWFYTSCGRFRFVSDSHPLGGMCWALRARLWHVPALLLINRANIGLLPALICQPISLIGSRLNKESVCVCVCVCVCIHMVHMYEGVLRMIFSFVSQCVLCLFTPVKIKVNHDMVTLEDWLLIRCIQQSYRIY